MSSNNVRSSSAVGENGDYSQSKRPRISSKEGTSCSSTKHQRPPNQRLPLSFLPNRCKIKVREMSHRANLYHYDSWHERGVLDLSRGGLKLRVKVGEMRYGEHTWREYDHVVFDDKTGRHYLHIKLTPDEQRRSSVTHGWACLENTTKPIPPNKSYLEPRFVVYRKPVVLISLFDGIGGGRVALDRLEEEYTVVASFSSEKDTTAKAVVQRYDRHTVDLPDVENIDRAVVAKKVFGHPVVREAMRCNSYGDELHFIIIAGPPCQDLSQANAKDGVAKGALEGERSRFFFHVPRIVKLISDVAGIWTTHYIVENVEMSPNNMRIFSEFLANVKPFRVDFNPGGCCASLMSRRRLYFCSVLPEGGDIGLNNFIRSGCIHPAKAEGKTLDHVLAKHGWGDWEFMNSSGTLGTLTRRAGQGGQDSYRIRRKDGKGEARDAPQIINEDLLGFTIEHTKYGPGGKLLSEAKRRLLLGNTFMVFHVQHLLKVMHGYICDPENLSTNGGRYIKYLPQEICSNKLKSSNISRKDCHFYGQILMVVKDILKFDDYEEKSKGTMLEHMR